MVQFTVTNLEDSGVGSLRQAIESANMLSGKDEIIFEDSLSGGEISVIDGALRITDSVSIEGLGAEQLAIGNSERQIFFIDDSTENVIEVEISQLSLVNSGAGISRGGPFGSAILNQEKLTVSDSAIKDGVFPGSGIIVDGQPFSTEKLNDAELILINSTISGYTKGIENKGEKVTVIGSSIFDNDKSDLNQTDFIINGDGIVNELGGTLEVRNSTISNNSGSGIANRGTVNVSNSTISDNKNGGITENNRNTSEAEVIITSSIIAGNQISESPDSAEASDLEGEGTFTSGGNNLIGVGGNTSLTDGVNSDLVGTTQNPLDPKLTPIQDNGGNTPTQALLSNSPAIDAGSNPNSLEFDQRGAGFSRVVGSDADIGAFEVQSSNSIVSLSATTPTAIEGEENGVLTISRDGATNGELVVNLALIESSTARVEDYNFSGSNVSVVDNKVTVTIPDGQSSIDLAIEAIADTLAEEEETIIFNLSAGNGYIISGSNNSATVIIPQNDFDSNTVVTNANDDGAGSLRQAILNANLFEGTDTITFDPSLQGETITLTSGDLVITDEVNIEGLGDEQLAVSGNNNSRIFTIDDGNDSTQIDVTISGLTIKDGLATGELEENFFDRNGGGIFNRENLTINNSTISGNSADGLGGGIFKDFTDNSNLVINNSSIIDNVAQFSAAGIFSGGGLEITNSDVSRNSVGNLYTDEIGIISGNAGGIESGNNTIITSTTITDNSGVRGGGIQTSFAEITDSTITGNTSTRSGGGISIYSGTIANSIISNNSSGNDPSNQSSGGGGIFRRGNDNLKVIESTISSNSAQSGGGIYDESFTGSLEIVRSTISDNTAEEGGGISNVKNSPDSDVFDFDPDGGNIEIIQSTISGNSANTRGGGILNQYATLDINNSTVSNNSAPEGSGIYNSYRLYVDLYGGGRYTYSSDTTIASTIIAGNSDNQDVGGESDFTSNGNNLIGNGDGATGFTDGVNNDIVGTTANAIDPLLGTLQDNGGTTPTIALLTGSPAIDAGSNPLNLTTDQRGSGFPRTVDGDGDGVAAVDIGAFEADSLTLPNPGDGGGNANNGELIVGTNGRDSLVGGDANDIIDGGNGNDTLIGGAGNDELFGGNGRDSLVGNNGRDTLRGGNGSDNLNGSAGNDELFGNSGGDFLVGGSGNDFIDGGNGSDTLIGGLGEDRFVIRLQNGVDNIIDYRDGSDLFVLSNGLSFGQLNLVERNNSTEIRLEDNNQLLTRVSLVSIEVIDESDFVES